MKNRILIAIFLCTVVNHAIAQMASDGRNISKAGNALDVSHNCDNALMYLRLVSDSGKTQQNYLLTMAKANDCKANNEQAIYYYNKFLEKSPGNDSVKKRVAELKDVQVQGGKAIKQEKRAKEYYKNAKNGFNGPCFDGKDFAYGLAADIATGGTAAPYKRSFSFFNASQYPFAKKHLLFEFLVGIGYMNGGQKSWFAQVFNTTPDNVTKVPGSIQTVLELSLAAIVLNKHEVAVSVGPALGINAYLMPGVSFANDNISNDYTNPIMFSPVLGLRSNVYFKSHWFFSAEYSHFLKSSYSNDLQQLTTVTELNGDALRISVGVRGFGFPRYHYMPN